MQIFQSLKEDKKSVLVFNLKVNLLNPPPIPHFVFNNLILWLCSGSSVQWNYFAEFDQPIARWSKTSACSTIQHSQHNNTRYRRNRYKETKSKQNYHNSSDFAIQFAFFCHIIIIINIQPTVKVSCPVGYVTLSSSHLPLSTWVLADHIWRWIF